MTTVENRIRGVLIGTALGDAMGMPTEYWTQAMIDEVFPEGVKKFYPTQSQDFFGRTMRAGEITDDTANTMLVLDTLVESKGRFSTEKYINKLIEWKNSMPTSALVIGPSTAKALELIAKGVSMKITGKYGTTNGSAMKVSPIGIVSDYKHLEELADEVESLCLPTHNTGIAIAGACVIAACISYVTSGGNDLDELWNIAIVAAEIGQKRGFSIPCPSLVKRIEKAREIATKYDLSEARKMIYEELGTGVETIETIPAVLAMIQLAKGDPMIAAQLCASLGGDTDTIGAISCAICGGMNPDFDESLVKFLEDTNDLIFTLKASEIKKYSPFND